MVSEKLLLFAAINYGFDQNTLHFISDSTNQIYTFKKDNQWFILRFSERPAEQTYQTKAEMDWLFYLAKNQVNVSLPLKTINNELVLTTEAEGKSYIVSSFEALPGKFWNKNNSDLWNEKIFYDWGKMMGNIHALTKDYLPANNKDVRDEFTGQALSLDKLKTCPTIHKIVEDLLNEIISLPKDKDSYGLIHYDIHPWNFIIDGDNINVFDFDDSLYGWFAMDIGIALYHGLWWGRIDDTKPAPKDFTNIMIKSFLQGYLSENKLSNFWLAKIPLFMKFRQICKFSWFYDPENMDEHQKERIRNIENNILFTDDKIDYSLFKYSN